MSWDETSLTPPDPLVERSSQILTAFEGTCIECNEAIGHDEVAIATYEVQSKPRVLHIGQTGYVSATYSDTPVSAWIHVLCLRKMMYNLGPDKPEKKDGS